MIGNAVLFVIYIAKLSPFYIVYPCVKVHSVVMENLDRAIFTFRFENGNFRNMRHNYFSERLVAHSNVCGSIYLLH